MRFTLTKRPGGGFGLSPTFNLADWQVTESSESNLIYKPTLSTWLKRLAFTAVLGAIAGLLVYYYFPHIATATFQTRIDPYTLAVCGVTILLIIFAILPPAFLIGNRIHLELDGRQARIRSGGFLRRRRQEIPLTNLKSIEYGFREVVIRGKYGRVDSHYWEWYVHLLGLDFRFPIREFVLARQKDRPGAQGKPPSRVIELINFFYRPTRIPVNGPIITEERAYRRSFWGRGKQTFQQTGPVKRTQRIDINDLDKLPADQRALMEQVLAGGKPAGIQVDRVTTRRYTVRDAQGNEQTYDRIEDMPPELQEHFRHLR